MKASIVKLPQLPLRRLSLLSLALVVAASTLPTTANADAAPASVAGVVPVGGVPQAGPVSSPSTTLAIPAAEGTVAERNGLVQLAHLQPRDASTFSMVGVTWQRHQGADLTVEFRARANGQWSAWTATTGQTDDQATGRGGTEPLFIGASDGIEIRVLAPAGTTASGVEATLITPQQTAADAALAKIRPAAASTGINSPAVITRAGWGANESLLSRNGASCVPPDYDSTIKAVIVHHTEGTNSYTQAQSAGIVRGIYEYHVISRGWCDIGYNALVDKYGQVFEGRHGGLNFPVHGAHAGSWNTNTFGISMMMNSNTAAPSSVGLTAMTQMIAWKLANNYVAPTGTVTLAGKSINIIEGHGTVMATDCPGTNLRNYLPTLRTRVAQAMSGYTNSAIYQRWRQLGGVSGELGAPFELEHAIAGGRRTEFANGGLWQTPTGTIFKADRRAYRAADRVGLGTTGWPTANQSPVSMGTAGAAQLPLTNGVVYSSPTTGGHYVTGAILTELTKTGVLARVGLPTGSQVAHSDGSLSQEFEHASITIGPSGQVTIVDVSLARFARDGRADLLLVDAATHQLWWAANTSDSGFTIDKTPLGRGWGGFNWFQQVFDLNGDTIRELVARRSDGTLWLYLSNGPFSFEAGTKIGHGWDGMRNLTVMADQDGDGRAELFGVDHQQQLRRYSFTKNFGYLSGGAPIGKNWGDIVHVATVGQFNGDSVPDLLATTRSGDLIAYTMRPDGRTSAATKVGRGWNGFDQMFSPGDINGDGRADLLGRNASTGQVNGYLFAGDGRWVTRTSLVDGTGYRLIA